MSATATESQTVNLEDIEQIEPVSEPAPAPRKRVRWYEISICIEDEKSWLMVDPLPLKTPAALVEDFYRKVAGEEPEPLPEPTVDLKYVREQLAEILVRMLCDHLPTLDDVLAVVESTTSLDFTADVYGVLVGDLFGDSE